MVMPGTLLYSTLLELETSCPTFLPRTMGHQIHAMFLQLIARIDPALSRRLHDEPGYRPFALSPVLGGTPRGNHLELVPGQVYQIRATLFDDGQLWDRLSTLLLETGPLDIQLGEAVLTIIRVRSTSSSDTAEWVGRTSWEQLAALPARERITLIFASPTAFNINGQYFALVPEPMLVWGSLLRSWNTYAPTELHIQKHSLQDILRHSVSVTTCQLDTRTLHYANAPQKGFTGTCTYQLPVSNEYGSQLTGLAAFARFAGVGYKTTMGMGQVRFEERKEAKGP